MRSSSNPKPLTKPSADSVWTNPYAATVVADMEAHSETWPWIPLKPSRRVRRLARDADRAAFSLIGAVFLGTLGPLIFTIFFTGHLWSYDRLVRRYPQLLDHDCSAEPVARSFAVARDKLVRWQRVYGCLLLIELALIFVFVMG